MRPIDADRLLEERRMKKYYHLPNGDTAIPIIDIEHAPTVELDKRWIPVSERLPKQAGRYLISVLDGRNVKRTISPYHPRMKSWTLTGRMAYWKVIAWMPLPEPWKGEEE